MSTCYLPEIILSIRDTVVNKTDEIRFHMELVSAWVAREIRDK